MDKNPAPLLESQHLPSDHDSHIYQHILPKSSSHIVNYHRPSIDTINVNQVAPATTASESRVLPRCFSRWFVFGICIIITAVGGTGNAFGLYSPLLKSKLQFTQSQLDLVSSVGNIGLYLGIVSGAFYGRWGVRATVLMGACLTFIGFGTLWLIMSDHLVLTGHAALFLVAFMQWLGQLGSSFLQTATTSTSVRNFPITTRGQAVGLMKGIFGLSASVLASFYVGLLDSNAVHYLLFIAIFCPVVQAIGSLPLNILPPHMVPFSYDIEQQKERDQQKQINLQHESSAKVVAQESNDHNTSSYQLFNSESRSPQQSYATFLDVNAPLSNPNVLNDDVTFRFTGPISRRLPLSFALSYFGSPQTKGINWWTNSMLLFAFYLAGLSFLGENIAIPSSVRIISVVVILAALASYAFLPRRHGPIRVNVQPPPPNNKKSESVNPATVLPAVEVTNSDDEVSIDSTDPDENGSLVAGSTDIEATDSSTTSRQLSHPTSSSPTAPTYVSSISSSGSSAAPGLIRSPSLLPPIADFTLSEAVRTVNFWLMFLSVFLAGGVGLVIINNIAQITGSLNPTHPTASAHVTLIGFGNFFGRVVSGTVSDCWPHIMTRPTFCSLASLLSSLGFLLMYIWSDVYSMTYPVSILIGLTYGAWFCLAPTVAADLYGTKHHGAIYGAMALGPTGGSIFFSTFIVNLFYHANSDSTGSSGDSETCLGSDCFHNTYAICAAASFLSAISSYLVSYRSRPIYARLLQQQEQQTKLQAKATRMKRTKPTTTH